MAETLQLRGTLRGHNGYVALVISFCYSNLKESFVKQFNERLSVLEKLTQKCDTFLTHETSYKRAKEE